ncbi:MAG: zinc-dependent metalloprotease, partial [Bacteroidota bacterium]
SELAGDQVELDLELGETSLPFSLYRREYRSPDFRRVFASGRVDVHPRPSVQFKGQLQTFSGGVAHFTFDDDFLLGQWEQDGETWSLVPLWLMDANASRDVYLLYETSNLLDQRVTCATDLPETPVIGVGRNRGWIGARDIELAVAVDSLMYREFPDAESLENFILGLLALVQADYDRGFEGRLCFQLSGLYFSDGINEEPWTSLERSESLIASFRDWGNDGNWDVPYDMAALWTGRDLAAGTSGNSNIGFAYIDAACSDRRYHIVEYWTRIPDGLRAIWSHEIGHNLGGRHVNGNNLIMNANLSAGNRNWSATARGAINNSVRNFTCLDLSPWLLFTAVGENQTGILDWSFTWQELNDGFFVERSANEVGIFEPLAWVPANENQGNRLYRYLDEGLAPGSVYYYRLRQISNDGSEYITPVRRVVISYPPGVRVAPNPALETVRIVSSSDVPSDFRITDIRGRIVRSGKILLGGTDVSLVGLAAGVYLYYEVDGKETRFVTRIVKR